MGELLLLAAEHVNRMSLPTMATVGSGWVIICGFGRSSVERRAKLKNLPPGLSGHTKATPFRASASPQLHQTL